MQVTGLNNSGVTVASGSSVSWQLTLSGFDWQPSCTLRRMQRTNGRVLTGLVPLVVLLVLSGRAQATELSNATPLTVPSNGACCTAKVASSYPSSIEVPGSSGITTQVAVTLHDVSDPDSEDLAVLLVGPSGHGVVLMASYEDGRRQSLNGATWTFESFAQPIECPAPEGAFATGNTFAPFDCGLPDPFPAPAPPAPYGGMLESLGSSGVWSLYLDNQPGGEESRIAGGWSLRIAIQPSGSFPSYHPPELPWADKSGNEGAARTVQEQREKEQAEQRAQEAASHALQESAMPQPGQEKAMQPAVARPQARRGCVVPALKGDTLAAARRALAAAHCRVGAVHRTTHRPGRLRVSRQTVRAGKRLADDARVAIWVRAGGDGK
jgi:hypothetical protein